MNRSMIAACAGVLALAWGGAQAEDDTAQVAPAEMVVCSVRDAALCAPDGTCTTIAPGGEDPLPDFLWVDFVTQRVWSSLSGPEDATEIFGVHQDGDSVMLYGAQGGMAWAMAINAQSGAMALAGAGSDGVRNIFGACTRVPRAANGQ